MCCWFGIILLAFYFVYDWYKRRKYIDGIHKKCVFITGCDTGFGNALAKKLDSAGMVVFAGCLTEKGVQNLREASSDRLHAIIADVTKSQDIQDAYDYVTKHLPTDSVLWGIVNNAGIPNAGPVEFIPRDSYEKVFAVNLFGMVEVTRTFLPLLKTSKGRIVNTASMNFYVAPLYAATYNASKFAVEGYSDTLRREMFPWGVSVSIVEPGFFRTSLVDQFVKMLPEFWDKASPHLKEQYGEQFKQELIDLVNERTKSMANSDLSPVASAYEHALLSVCPRARYRVGTDAVISWILSRMPTCVSDRFLRMKQFAMPLPLVLRQKQE